MFRDKDEELRRLEALLTEEEEDEQLLAEEAAEEDIADREPEQPEADEEYDIDRFFMEQTQVFSAYNTDRTDTDLEELSQQVWEGTPKSSSGLVALACVLATGILLVILYLVLRYGGLL